MKVKLGPIIIGVRDIEKAKNFYINIGTYKNSEFIVLEMSNFLVEVKNNGGKVISEPVERPWGGINAEIADPDGNIF